MSAISTWSTTAAGNNSAAPDGWPEGQTPSSLNNCGREVMAAVRTQHERAAWLDLGHTPTFVDTTNFTVVGDQTAQYTVGRRVRLTDSSVLYGTITVSAYTSLTTVTVSLDSGSLSTTLNSGDVSLGILDTKSIVGIQDLIDAAEQAGFIKIWGGLIANIPSGYVLCDGTAYDADADSTYSDLFAAIGNAHGGADNTDFEVPNLTDRFIIHASADTGDTYDVADTGGLATHSHTDDLAAPAHTHSVPRTGWGSSSQSLAGVPLTVPSGSATMATTGVTSGGASATALTGGVDDGATIPPYYALAYVIKL